MFKQNPRPIPYFKNHKINTLGFWKNIRNIHQENFVYPLNKFQKCLPYVSTNETICFWPIVETQCNMNMILNYGPNDHIRNQIKRKNYYLEQHIIRKNYLQDSYRFFIEKDHNEEIQNDDQLLNLDEMSNSIFYDKGEAIIFHCGHYETDYKSSMSNQLIKNGASFIGKTVTSDFDGQDDPSFMTKKLKNPHDPSKIIGGHLGSAAAIAAGIGNIGLANDQFGSIRNSASFTGTVGLKTSNLIKIGNDAAHIGSGYMSEGLISRSVIDTAIVFDIFTGNQMEYYKSAKGSLGIPSGDFGKIAVLRKLPHSIVDENVIKVFDEAIDHLNNAIHKKGIYIPDLSIIPVYHLNFEDNPDLNNLENHAKIIEAIESFFLKFDFLITPTVPILPWDINSKSSQNFLNPYTYLFNLANLSAISIPCGYTDPYNTGFPIPIGIQIIRKSSQFPNEIHEKLNLKQLLNFAAYCESIFGSMVYDNTPAFQDLRYDLGKS